MRRFALVTAASLIGSLLLTPVVQAQESKLGAELRRERERLAEKCSGFGLKEIGGCAVTLVTDHPFHLAIGSLAPNNGFGLGLAFVAPQWKPNDAWRISWSADAVGTPSSAWRAGAYAKFVNSRVGDIEVTGPGGGTAASDALPRPYPTITVYGQVTSLPKLWYFGQGNDTAAADLAAFGMRHSTLGTRVVWPIGRGSLFNRLNPIVIGEANGRWVGIETSPDGPEPSIEMRYTDATAPGLGTQPAMLQLGEGLRVAPSIGRLQLTYTGILQHYIAPSDSSSSFRRWTLDLGHAFSLWTTRRYSGPREQNSPNECGTSADRTLGDYGCPDAMLATTNRVGTVGFRALLSRSGVSAGGRVPFYFQRTIGGSDIDGERLLASYDDYRFRAPNLVVFQQTIEHSIWGPIGAFAAAEQGRVALIGDPLFDGEFKRTYGAGLTLRAGGVPMVTVWWADGGGEGHHVAITMNTSLLGGSARPSLR